MTKLSSILYNKSTMKAKDIAALHKIDETVVSHIKHERRFTDNIDLAFDIAKITKQRPIKYIFPKLHKLALAAHPELGRKAKN